MRTSRWEGRFSPQCFRLDGGGAIIYTSPVGNLRRLRWQTLDRDGRIALGGLAVLLAGAVCVRVWLMIDYRPAFLGFPDSGAYALAAAENIFRDTQRPAGYPFFLRLIRHVDTELTFTIVLQHVMGIATGLLLYKAVRRTGAPAWLGLVPAAVVFFGATGLFLEHALLADPLFAFLQAVGVYAAIRALHDTAWRWSLLAGVAIGLDFWIKTAATTSAILVPVVLLCAAPGPLRRRGLDALTVAAVVIAMVIFYVGSQYYFTGYFGYERQSAWDLYGRVATFVDCSKLTPPPGTGFLCPPEPVGQRAGQNTYQYAPTEPAAGRFGPPWEAPLYANGLLKEFSVAVIEQQPLAYAGAIASGLGRYVFPRPGESSTPQEFREAVTATEGTLRYQPEVAYFYVDSLGYYGSGKRVHSLAVYEKYTLVQGPLLVLLLVCAGAGLIILRGRMRWSAIVFTLTALFSITFAVAGNGYDARYAYPTFGPLAAGAALGAWGIGTRLKRTQGIGTRLNRRLRGRVQS
jgi:hypothetical protein